MPPKILLLILIMCTSFLFAQDKLLTLEDAILGSQNKLSIENMEGLSWIAGSDAFCYVDSVNGVSGLFVSKADDSSTELIIALDDFNDALTGYNLQPLDAFPEITWLDQNRFQFLEQSHLFYYSLRTKSLNLKNKIDDDAENTDICENNIKVAYVKNDNLFIAYDENRLYKFLLTRNQES